MSDKFRHGRAGTKKFFEKHGRRREGERYDRRERYGYENRRRGYDYDDYDEFGTAIEE